MKLKFDEGILNEEVREICAILIKPRCDTVIIVTINLKALPAENLAIVRQ